MKSSIPAKKGYPYKKLSSRCLVSFSYLKNGIKVKKRGNHINLLTILIIYVVDIWTDTDFRPEVELEGPSGGFP